jgi:hypothetical protein
MIIEDIQPLNNIEWLWTLDLVELSLEILRYRRLKKSILDINRATAIEAILRRLDGEGMPAEVLPTVDLYAKRTAAEWRDDRMPPKRRKAKELVGFTDRARESAQDWRSAARPEAARARRAAAAHHRRWRARFWKAAGEVWPKTREQRCWVHKTAHVLAKLPKSPQPKAKRALQEIWMAETRAAAELAFDAFIESYTPKYEKAADCMSKDRDALLAFYDFPAEHWKHLRTTNPIESTFATVRHRTIRSKGCLSNGTALAMVFKLLEGIQKSWRRLDGHNQLPKLVLG